MRSRWRGVRASLVGTAVVLGASAVIGVPAVAGTPWCGGRAATIVGTSGSDELSGTQGRDVIVGNGGNDVIRSRSGNDLVCAGGGDDVVYAGAGVDRVVGGEGADIVGGGKGHDQLDGGPGVDTLRMVTSTETVVDLDQGWSTGAGTDALDRFEILVGSGTASYDVRTGRATRAVQVTGDHEDTVRTLEDAVGVTASRLTLSLGQRSDIYLVRRPDVVVVEDIPDVSTGRDVVDVRSAGTTTISDASQGLRVVAVGSGSEVVSARADESTVTLDTGDGDDRADLRLTGGSVSWLAGPGRDRLSGSLPADSTIRLGTGADVVSDLQSLSADPVDGAGGIDRVVGGDGRDEVDLATLLWRWGGVQVLVRGFEQADGGAGEDRLRGDAAANTLLGGPGSDILRGRAGADVIRAGVGVDAAYGGPGDDWCAAETRTACERP